MSLYNRFTQQNKPNNWDATHKREDNPNKGNNWNSWFISPKTFCDSLTYIYTGLLSYSQEPFEKIQEVFDLSDNEKEQVKELYHGAIYSKSDLVFFMNLSLLERILSGFERGIPLQFGVLDTEEKFNAHYRITTGDDR